MITVDFIIKSECLYLSRPREFYKLTLKEVGITPRLLTFKSAIVTGSSLLSFFRISVLCFGSFSILE